MPYESIKTSKDKKEIKLYYQLFFAEINISLVKKNNWNLLTKESDSPFLDEILEDLQNRNLSSNEIDRINNLIEHKQLYFKVYRDDEEAIPENALLLQHLRILPNHGLLSLDEKLKNKINEWTPSFVTQTIEALGDWAWNHLPALKMNRANNFPGRSDQEKQGLLSADPTNVSEEDVYFSADELDDESDEIISQTLSQDTPSESDNLKLNPDKKHSFSFFNQAINSTWQLISYAAQNPAKAITLMLSTQIVAAAALGATAKSSSSVSPQDSKQKFQPKTNSGIQLHTENLSTQAAQASFIFPLEIAPSSLNGMNGFKLIGVTGGDNSGWSISGIGDINGDGIADIVIGAPFAGPLSEYPGATYVVFGQKKGWPASLSLGNLNGTNGFKFMGINIHDQLGISVSGAGDINGDGISDIMIGAISPNNGAGVTYVVFGQKSAWPAIFSLESLNGTNGFNLTGVPKDVSGCSLSTGDINGDGITDILIGAYGANDQAGGVYVVFGQKSRWPSTLSLATLNGTNGFKLIGVNPGSPGDRSGSSVSVSDINGDGIADMLIGAPSANNGAGVIYVVFGQENGWSANFLLSSLNGTNGFNLTGINANDMSGVSLDRVSDLNGDGIGEILIGAIGVNNYAGAVYVVFSQKNRWPASMSLASLNGTNGFALTGVNVHEESGYSVSGISDINGDGIPDMLIGADTANHYVGITYVVFGQKNGWPATLSLANLNGTNGFNFTSAGYSVSKAGDINGDGIVDMLIGSTTAYDSAGATFVVFGHRPPKFYTNYLNIQRGMTQILSSENLNATCGIDIFNLMFTVENVQYGRFELINQIGIPVFSFQQEQIWKGQLQFVHDGSLFPPAYIVRMHITEFFNTTAYTQSAIHFTPVLFQNQLAVNQGQSVILNPNNLNATYQNVLPENLLFSITAIQHGQFSWNGLTQPITVFSYQNVIEGKVQFTADGSVDIPQYSVSVLANNVVQTGVIPSKIIFYLIPVLHKNNLVINQGQTTLLSSANFNATDSNAIIPLSDIIFDILSLQHGYFSFVTSSQTSINRFSQENITTQVVQFTQDNTGFKPNYFFTVTGSYDTQLGPIAGMIDFDPFPILIRNELNIRQSEAVILSSNNLNATHNGNQEGNLLFNIINLAHGYFYYVKNPNNFIISFYQDNITKRQVMFLQDGTIEAPLFQISVTDGRTSSAYEQAKINFQLTPTPAPIIISTPNSKNSFDDFLMKSLISGAISGVIGLGFLVIKIYLSHKAQKKLNQITEEKEGVGKDLAEYRNSVIRPVARTIFERVKLSSCLGHVSDETMTDYLSAIETLVSALSRRGVLDSFDALSVPQQHQIIHEVAKQTKQVLVPAVACCSSENFFRFFRPDITPDDIEKNAGKIVDCVVTALQESVTAEDDAQELNTNIKTNVSGESDTLLRPLLGMV